MKNKIMLFYNLENIEVSKNGDNYFFRIKDKMFSFEKIYSISKFKEMLSFLNKTGYLRSFKIIKNIYGQDTTLIDNTWFVLLMHYEEKIDLYQEIMHPFFISGTNIYPERWDFLWIRKIDYYEYQVVHVSPYYPILVESFNYFIGLAENAISYVNYNFYSKSRNDAKISLCHFRISLQNFFDPLNFTIDYYVRDVAEYFKFLFFSYQYKDFDFESFLKNSNLSFDDFVLLYSRLLFPSYYFDLYDDILNKQVSENQLKKIIFRQNEYYMFLQYIYDVICTFVFIPPISWIKKEML